MLPVQCNAASEQELAGLVEEYSAMKPQVVKAVKAAHQQAERCIKVVALL
jgi:aminopeptidase N